LSGVETPSLVSEFPRPLRVAADEGRHAEIEPGYLSARLMRHGSMELRWYAPQGSDPQLPHDRDELYFIVSGHGVFMRAEEKLPFGEDRTMLLGGVRRVSVQPGDALFVPAGTEHRFESMSSDFGAWIVFYGPEGGERPCDQAACTRTEEIEAP
jgi:mannose-6-phosphate isomerase-like protein (cupin superfamily)